MGKFTKSLAGLTEHVNARTGLCGAGAALLLFGAASRTDAAQIFWAEYGDGSGGTGAVWTANSDGTGAHALVTSLYRGIGVAVDTANSQVYFSDGGSGSSLPGFVGRVNFSGSGQTTLVNLGTYTETDPTSAARQYDAQMVKLDLTHSKVYWASYYAGIHRANLDGSSPELVTNALRTQPTAGTYTHLALDVPDNLLYFGSPSIGGLYHTDLAGASFTTVSASALGGSNGMAINAARSKIYYPDANTGTIKVVNIDGSNEQTLVSGLSVPLDVALSPDETEIYWTERPGAMGDVGNRIGGANINGSNVHTIVTAAHPFGIAVAVPEPGTLSLLVFAGGTLLMRRRRTEN